MNDRLKFRVWSNKYNDYLSPEIITTIMGLCKSNDLTTVRIGTLPSFDNNLTIEQCTGLKDKNGNLIYEGDIVRCDRDFDPKGRVNLTKEVIFTDGSFMLANLNPENRDFCYLNRFHNIEIIGNVHEQKDAA